MAPPTTGIPIQIRIPRELLDQIDCRRESTGQSRSEAIRKMLIWAIKQPAQREEQ